MLGAHVQKHDRSLSDAIEEDIHAYNMTCMQTFASQPFSGAKLSKADIDVLKEASKRVQIVLHGAYVDFPWTTTKNRGLMPTLNICKELEVCQNIGATGVIIHLHNVADEQQCLDILKTCKRQNADGAGPKIWLETNAAINSPFADSRRLRKLCKRLGPQFGVCVDTAHLWTAGVSVSEYAETVRWLKPLDGLPIMFHLNDCSTEFGSGKDKHEILCRGKIWKRFVSNPAKSGIKAITDFAIKNGSMVILERSGTDYSHDYAILAKLGFGV